MVTSETPPTRRDEVVDVMRGITTASMILVNSSTPGHVFSALVHARLGGGLTFADTIYPTFLFTSGMVLPSEPRFDQKTLRRSIILIGLGLANNALSLLPPSSRHYLRLPGVLQRTAISTLVASIPIKFFYIPPILLAVWSSLTKGQGGHSLIAHSRIDRSVFGRHRMYRTFFDPEGIVGTLTTAPLSVWCGRAFALYGQRLDDWTLVSTASALCSIPFSAFVTVVTSSAISKDLWTPPFVTFNVGVSIATFVVSRRLVNSKQDNAALYRAVEAMKTIGEYSLEAYLFSQTIITLLRKSGMIDLALKLLEGGLHLNKQVSGLLCSVGFVTVTWYAMSELKRRRWKIRM